LPGMKKIMMKGGEVRKGFRILYLET